MNDNIADRPNRLPWPPLIYGGAIALAWVLQTIAPLAALDAALGALPRLASVLVVAVGAALDLGAMWAMRARQTTILPNAGASRLVSHGVFAFSRNPIYLGNTLVLAGLAVTLRWGWLIALAALTVPLVARLAIAREERHLEARFGEEWRAYASRVRRWI